MLKYDEAGNLYDDGQPDFSWVEKPPVAQITVSKPSPPKPDWVEGTPIRNPDATPYDIAAYRVKRAVQGDKQPVQDDREALKQFFGPNDPKRPSYLMEPDLLEKQKGELEWPAGLMQTDDGRFYYVDSPNETVPMVSRPNVLPIASTPEGFKFAVPKMLDIVGNVGSPLAAGKVPMKAGEVVLGSGAVRTMEQLTPNAMGFYSSLERAVDNAKINKADAQQWLGYLRNQPGVKAEEIQWVLGELPEGQISKEQLKGLMNKVELRETNLGVNRDKEMLALFNKQRKYSNAYFAGDEGAGKKLDKINEQIELLSNEVKAASTKYHQYQLSGGENYREMLINLPEKPGPDAIRLSQIRDRMDEISKLPAKETDPKTISGKKYQEEWDKLNGEKNKLMVSAKPAETFNAPHFDEHGKNLLAHIRMNDRVIDGKKTLHGEEWQSDWLQQGRDFGFKGEKAKLEPEFNKIEQKIIDSGDESIMGNPSLKDALKQAVDKKIITQDEARQYERFTKVEANENRAVPDAPFKKNWEELAIKRLIHKAAKEGYDAISWTPGEAQALRYQNEIRQKIDWIDWSEAGKDKKIRVKSSGGSDLSFNVNKDGIITSGAGSVKGKTVDEVLGKDFAKQIMEKREGKIDAKGYVMGAEGFKQAYDKRAVDIANAIGKKYGAKVESKNIPVGPQYKSLAHFMDWAKANYGERYSRNQLGEFWKHGEQIPIVKEFVNSKRNQPIHFLPLSPQLKSKALDEGFPLFSSSPILSPVDYVPEFEDKKKYKLIPVRYNPFKDKLPTPREQMLQDRAKTLMRTIDPGSNWDKDKNAARPEDISRSEDEKI